jgi:DNA invertase Pin-like site-specific DNA recombinase
MAAETELRRVRVCLLLRKSHQDGTRAKAKREISLEYQEETCTAWCDEHGPLDGVDYAIVAVRREDDMRYYLKSRDVLMQVVRECNAGLYDLVLCYDMTRFTANSDDLGWLNVELRDTGARLRMVHNDVPDGPYSRVIRSLQADDSGQEVARIRLRTGEGKEKRMARNQPLARVAPYGMRWNHEANAEDAKQASTRYLYLLPRTDTTAGVARRIFDELAAGGRSMGDLVRAFNAEGIPGPHGGLWSRAGLSVILKNPAYCGVEATGRTRRTKGPRYDDRWTRERQPPEAWRRLEAVKHRPLVTVDVWEAAQRAVAGRTIRTARPDSLAGRALLRGGLATCTGCGGPLWAGGQYTVVKEGPGTAPAGVTVVYYQCSSRHGVVKDAVAAGVRRDCAEPAHIRADVLDHAVWAYVLDLPQTAPAPETPGRAAEREDARRKLKREHAKLSRDLQAGERKALHVAEPHRLAALEALNDATAGRLTAIEAELDRLESTGRRDDAARERAEARRRALWSHRARLYACRPWAVDRADDDAMRELVLALGVRAGVTRSPRPRSRETTYQITDGPMDGPDITGVESTTRRGLRRRNNGAGAGALPLALARFRPGPTAVV